MLNNRYDFVLLFEVVNGNPNGDPDAGNMPRIDMQTGHGIVTDVCIKRKVRNYVEIVMQGRKGYDIFVTEGAALNSKMKLVYDDFGLNKDTKDVRHMAREYMCARYFDVRAFGAVMDTGDYKCGQVRGPVQLCFGRSIDPILQQEITITRMAATNENEDPTKNRTMGRKYAVPYGLYRMEGFISPPYAVKTGFTQEDLDLFWKALINMFELDHSASRGRMATRRLIAFQHDTALGNAPSYALFEGVKVQKKHEDCLPRAFGDYEITVARPPEGVTLLELA